jgi:hypothetical protein
MNKRERLIYMAGFFDGEGCIGINKTTSATKSFGYRVEVQISQVKKEPLLFFQEKYGGGVYLDKRSLINKNWQDCWHWCIAGRAAKKCLNDLLPFLINNKNKAKIALEFFSLPYLDNSINSSKCTEKQRNNALVTNENIIKKRKEIYNTFRRLCTRNTKVKANDN